MSFVLEVVEEYSMEGLMMKLQHLGQWCPEPALSKRPWCWERLYAEGEKWEYEIMKDREACFVAEHVITKSQTWLSNWMIPMRTQGLVKALVLVGVEKDLVGRGGFPSSGAGPWIQGKEHKILNVLPNIVFLIKQKTVFCRSENLTESVL